MRAALVVVVIVPIVIAPMATFAQDFDPEACDDGLARGPMESFPAHRSSGVSLGAPIRVRYTEEYFTDPVIGADPQTSFSLTQEDSGAIVPGRIEVIEDTLIFVSDAPLEPGVDYVGTALGIDTGSFDFSFRTGFVFDEEPPIFDSAPTLRSFEVGPSCDAPEGGYRIEVTFEPAEDPDGPPGDVEYILFLTRGPAIDEPEVRDQVRNLTVGEAVMAFVIDPSEAVSPICISVLAVDGVGHVTEGQTVCDDPIKGNFFEPCTASPGRTPSWPWALMLGVGVVFFVRRRR